MAGGSPLVRLFCFAALLAHWTAAYTAAVHFPQYTSLFFNTSSLHLESTATSDDGIYDFTQDLRHYTATYKQKKSYRARTVVARISVASDGKPEVVEQDQLVEVAQPPVFIYGIHRG